MGTPPRRRSLLGLGLLVLGVSAAHQGWLGYQRRTLGAQVAALAGDGDIHMLSSRTCSVCTAARAWFREHDIRYTECTIESDPECRAVFEATGAAGTPVLLVKGRAQLGFAPQRLHQALLQPAVGG